MNGHTHKYKSLKNKKEMLDEFFIRPGIHENLFNGLHFNLKVFV